VTHLDTRDQHDGPGGSEPPVYPPRPADEPKGSSALRLGLLVVGVVLLGLWAGVSAVIVVLAIVAIIFLHELGHFLTARWAGMKCTEFFIGFGPRLWSFRRGETEYGIKAIPAGAYVKVIGMTNLEDVDPADEARTYRQKPYWRRMSVAVAGSAMHFLIAALCLFTFFVSVGVQDDARWEVGRLANSSTADRPSPAGEAGVQVGDRIVAFDGVAVGTFDELREEILTHTPGDEVVVTVERAGERLEIPVQLGELEGVPFLGVGPAYPTEPLGVGEAAVTTVTEFGEYSRLTVESITRIFSPSGLANFLGLAVDTARQPADDGGSDGPVSTPIDEQGDRVLSIYGAARLGTQMADTGLAGFLAFMALINIFIGIFNLVPLLPLDGGHVAIATYEKVRELLARSSARYHADVSKLLPVTYAVIFVMVGVGIVALYLDIANPVDLPN
jgi:membrane-associated protease RseP (regulator of RpoE activity)